MILFLLFLQRRDCAAVRKTLFLKDKEKATRGKCSAILKLHNNLFNFALKKLTLDSIEKDNLGALFYFLAVSVAKKDLSKGKERNLPTQRGECRRVGGLRAPKPSTPEREEEIK